MINTKFWTTNKKCVDKKVTFSDVYFFISTIMNNKYRGCASRSPEASETQLGRVKAICDLARLASGIIVVI